MRLSDRLAKVNRYRRRFQVWATALAGGIVAAIWMPPAFYEPAVAELIAMVAALVAGVLPTAILSATVLRAGGLPTQRILQARNALLQQLAVWAGIFGIAGISAILLTGGRLLKWSIMLPLDRLGGVVWNAAPIANSILTACLILLVLRAMTIFRGLRSLVILSAEIALSEATAREAPSLQAGLDAIEAMPPRTGFGRQVDLPHWPA